MGFIENKRNNHWIGTVLINPKSIFEKQDNSCPIIFIMDSLYNDTSTQFMNNNFIAFLQYLYFKETKKEKDMYNINKQFNELIKK